MSPVLSSTASVDPFAQKRQQRLPHAPPASKTDRKDPYAPNRQFVHQSRNWPLREPADTVGARGCQREDRHRFVGSHRRTHIARIIHLNERGNSHGLVTYQPASTRMWNAQRHGYGFCCVAIDSMALRGCCAAAQIRCLVRACGWLSTRGLWRRSAGAEGVSTARHRALTYAGSGFSRIAVFLRDACANG